MTSNRKKSQASTFPAQPGGNRYVVSAEKPLGEVGDVFTYAEEPSLATSGPPPAPVMEEPTAPLPSLADLQGASAAAFIDFTTPDGIEQRRQLGQSTSVGRHTDNVVQLLDPEVSKQHLVIEQASDGYWLRDLGSANGTLVNGVETGVHHLRDGDVVVIGNTRLLFRLEMPTAPSRPLPSSSPFDEMLGVGGQLAKQDPDQTVVTLVPSLDQAPDATSVFAIPMADDFPELKDVSDDEALRRDYERLRVAFDLACEVGLDTDLRALGESILQRIREVLLADTAVVMVRREDGEFLPLASYAGPGRGGEVRIPKAIVEQVVSTREALLTSDAQADMALRSSHTVVGQRIRSALCVPLLVRDEVYGVIHVSSSSAAGAFEERDMAMLRAIAQPAALAFANARLARKIEEDARMRAELSRFLSPALVERVVRQDLSLDTRGDTVKATVLFSDIRGFTSMSDGASPMAVVSMLNEYFEAMVEVVFECGGALDKFIGDGMMAVWGTVVQSPDDAVMAVKAAAKMREVLESVVNAARSQRGEAPLEVGYGLATGHVIAGGMGASRRQDFTVIGDTVNLASRLCGGAAPGQILMCEDTHSACVGANIPSLALDVRTVKGVARPVPVFEHPR